MPRHHRISRTLIAALVIVLALGVVFWLKNVSSTRAQEAAVTVVDRGSQPAPVQQPPPPQHPRPSVTVTPAPQGSSVIQTKEPNRTMPPPVQPTRTFGGTGNTSGAAPAGNVLLQARSRRDAGELLAARKLLNDAIISGTLSPADMVPARAMLGEINHAVFFSAKQFGNDEFGGTYTVKSGELLRTIADRHDVPWELIARLNGITDPRKLRAGQTLKVVKGPFHAVVTKGKYTLDVYLGPPGEKGSLFVRSFPVGLGSDDSTPTGTWLVETHKKLKNPTYFSPRGEGVIDADDPKNPLGERWIGLTGIDGQAMGKESYGIHGTIEPESIGKQASMGCIRLLNEDVEVLFDMLSEGKSTVVIGD